MEKEWGHMTEKILHLTLEIIYLLTGEIYGPLKEQIGCVTPRYHPHITGGWNRNKSPIMEPLPSPLTAERNDKKILEVTQKIMELLTGEVPIRCQDVTVYFSMEEWEYIEGHKDLYKDVMMENRPPLTSPDGSSNRNPPERCPRPLYSRDSTQEDQNDDLIIIEVEDVDEDDTDERSDEWGNEEELPPQISTDGLYKKCELGISHLNPSNDGLGLEEDDVTKESARESPITPNRAGLHRAHLLAGPLIHRPLISHHPHPIDHYTGHRRGKVFMPFEYSNCFTQGVTLHPHLATHGRESLLSCSDCGRQFTKHSHLLVHERIHTGEKLYTCSDCGKAFTKKSHLVTHQRIHTGEKPYSCSLCGKCFTDKSNLVKHEVIHTGDYPFACSICGKGFVQKSFLDLHERVHITDKPYTCMDCGKSFARNSHFVMHQRTHSEEKPYSCPECGKTFNKRSHFIAHELIHRKEKPFSCSVCGKGFAQKSNLVTHERIHTGDHPFSCSMCGKCFAHKSNLVRHERVHTGGLAYSCPWCGKWFAQKAQLVAHKNSHKEGTSSHSTNVGICL